MEQDSLQWISSRDALKPQVRPPRKQTFDPEASKILGFNVPTNHPKLIKLAVQWKRKSNKSEEDLRNDNHLRDPKKRKELKKAFDVA